VLALGCLAAAPTVRGATTFAGDLNLFQARNKVTAEAARELAAFVKSEQLFARSLGRTDVRTAATVRSYLDTLGELDRLTKRVLRDQKASDSLLASILALASRNRTSAAWILLKRGLEGQERFLKTIADTRVLMARCKALRATLSPAGG
ncbi:MAG: hypothetical protein ACPL2N_05640, partial [Candidatus Cryosericum sp.]